MSGQAAGHAGAFLRVLVLRAAELRPRRTDVFAAGALPARLLPRPGLAQLHLPLLHPDHRSRGAPRRLRDAARDPGAGPAAVLGRLDPDDPLRLLPRHRSEEHTSELQSLMRISYAVFCLKKKK